jgi:hypothetical protein
MPDQLKWKHVFRLIDLPPVGAEWQLDQLG